MNQKKIRSLAIALGLVASLGTTVALERTAAACGGCFVPPEDNTVVTDHRMILSVGNGESTLYDQIRYQGLPQEFAWVLPISGEATVGLSADTLFGVMGGFTSVNVVAPPRNCPAAPNCNSGEDLAAEAPRAGSADAASPGGVTVTKQENVGPYATVQLQSNDAEALNKWLVDNKFSIPENVKPVIAQYVREKFNFLALKLRPGANVQAMRPVRVTTKGPQVVLPLRMVAAGTGPIVGITLWVVGQGRYEPTNFPTFSIKAEELVWDWTKNESNFKDVRAARQATGQNRTWEVESAFRMPVTTITQALSMPIFANGQSSGDYTPIPPANGEPGKTAEEVREEDLAVLFGKQKPSDFFVTRMRTDIAQAALSEDLLLQAPADQTELSNVRQVTRELNEPLCPVYVGCKETGSLPRSEAIARSSEHCSTGGAMPTHGFAAAGVGFLALAIGRTVRRRRSTRA